MKRNKILPLHLIINGLVQALVWATNQYDGPVTRTAVAAVFHAYPTALRLTPWTELQVRHATTEMMQAVNEVKETDTQTDLNVVRNVKTQTSKNTVC